MYMNFYKLSHAPFNITPDPDFLFLSPSHKEALGAIVYCIAKRKGFVSVIGEIGTGKTTIIRAYLAKSDRKWVKPIYVFNADVEFVELLKTIFRELGVISQGKNIHDMVQQLHEVLIDEYGKGHNIVLIIDEAQHVPVATLEQLRMLSNLETTKEKLIQIILVGQPELLVKLRRHELRQLNQRLAIRATLQPLSYKESFDYIHHRLSRVTDKPTSIFSLPALRHIVKAAEGSPRKLNILCDNVLIAGFGSGEKRISAKLVKRVISDLEGKYAKPIFQWKPASVLMGVFFSVLIISGVYLAFPGAVTFAVKRGENSLASYRQSSQIFHEKQNMENSKKLTPQHNDQISKAQGGGGAADLPDSTAQQQQGNVTDAEKSGSALSSQEQGIDNAGEQNIVAEIDLVENRELSANLNAAAAEAAVPRDGQTKINQQPHSPEAEVRAGSGVVQGNNERMATKSTADLRGQAGTVPVPVAENGGPEPGIAANQIEPSNRTLVTLRNERLEEQYMTVRWIPARTRTVKKGEYLSQICLETYGYVDNQLIRKVKEYNPSIYDADLILTGAEIVLPEHIKF